MNFKTTIALLVLLLGLGAYLLFTRSQLSPTNKTTAANASKVLDLKSEDVIKVAVRPADGKAIVFEKTGGAWKIVEPIQSPAEMSEVDGLIRDVTSLESRTELDSSMKSTGGLDHPPYKVELTTKDKTTTVDIGDKPALGDDLPVLVEGQDKPRVVPASIVSRLQKPFSAYRQTHLLSVVPEAIKQLEITRNKQTIRLARTGPSAWQITSPKSMPAESSAVDSILFAITGLNATGFDDSISPADAGVSKPRITVSFSTEAPATQPATAPTTLANPTTIAFGGYDDVTNKEVYASVTSGSQPSASIAKISASTLDSFRKTALELRDKSVLNVDPDRVESFSVDIDHPATTQPTTAPASHRTYTIARRKEDHTLGPALPNPAPATRPASTPSLAGATEPTGTATPTTLPLTPLAAADTEPTTQPTTEPATRQASAPTTYSTKSIEALKPALQQLAEQRLSKWVFTAGGTDDAEETQVTALLSALHPLKAEKYLEPVPTTSPTTGKALATYILKIQAGPGAGAPAAEYELRITDAGGDAKPIAELGDLRFELDRDLLKKLDGDFKTKPAAPAPSQGFPGNLPPGHPGIFPPGGPQ